MNAAVAAAPLLTVRGVTLQFRTGDHLVTATYRISFDVYRSDRFVILGPSGCGKSTLLKAVGGYLRPAEGTISLNEAAVTTPGPDRVFVFQEFDQLLPWKTVKENITFALTAGRRMRRAEAEERAWHFIEKVKLTEFAESYPHTLSGGMKQRAAIARAMAMEPQVLLMDEPFAALDALTRAKMQEELLQLWEDTKFTVLFVTHSIPEAVRVGSRILVLSAHPGQVKAELNSRGVDETDANGKPLSARIQEMLFDGEIKEGAAAHV
ncbi:MAG TPA: ABC transporter ATP-binding protein [Bryobacteraceae bacterium]|nr:ABC transporter ATP-binding protein [Bryobacteraceae bacterium]